MNHVLVPFFPQLRSTSKPTRNSASLHKHMHTGSHTPLAKTLLLLTTVVQTSRQCSKPQQAKEKNEGKIRGDAP